MRTSIAATAALLVLSCGPAPDTQHTRHVILDAYTRFNDTPREIDPRSYIAFLKTTRFRGGELDRLPSCAIVLHDARPLRYLLALGIDTTRVERLVLGSSDPSVLFVVRRHAPNGPSAGSFSGSFIITPGLPGAGGIAIQTAELGALGTRVIVHVGTSGFLGDVIPDSVAVVSRGSYKDGGAVLLSASSESARAPISRPDSSLSATLHAALTAGGVATMEQTGFTVPIMYFQPSGLIRWLLEGPELAAERPAYVEMEQGAFFESARHMKLRAASIVVGSDRYRVKNDTLSHSFVDVASEPAKQRVISAVATAFSSLSDCASRAAAR
jgi:uridine phosphorylase